jgi:5-methylcytosine-specific restriction endonuclease McrA
MLRDLIPSLQLQRRAADMNARARRFGALGTLHPLVLGELFLKSGGVCAWCGKILDDAVIIEFDHVTPFRLRGENTRANLCVACADCNRRKADKHPARFAQEQAARGIQTPLVADMLHRHGLDSAAQGRLAFDDDLDL